MENKCDKNWIGGFEARPDWDTYFLTLAYIAAQRSSDPNTICGAVLVSSSRHILSTGYNSPIRNSDDSLVPTTRPEKYFHFLHAEENCLLAYNGSKQDLDGAVMYITGRPCHKCLRMILQKGIKKIVHSKNPAACLDSVDMDMQEMMIKLMKEKPEIIEIDCINKVKELLVRTEQYINYKL